MEVIQSDSALIICPASSHSEADVMEWERALEWAIEQGPEVLVFNCENLDLLTSMGLVFFLATHTKAQDEGLSFRMCNLRPIVDRALRTAGLHRVLAIYGTLEQATAGAAVD